MRLNLYRALTHDDVEMVYDELVELTACIYRVLMLKEVAGCVIRNLMSISCNLT